MPRVSISTPGKAFRALDTSALPKPLVSTESAVHRVAAICSGAKRGLYVAMAAESRDTQSHINESEGRALWAAEAADPVKQSPRQKARSMGKGLLDVEDSGHVGTVALAMQQVRCCGPRGHVHGLA